ncbi:hypothetical protein N7452_003061 [Penicillium brevicompactum]|uniref:Ankyrin repeat protein n=1 Tax=Penicillium brevicompactum TaxID=5074 RepID=A0A9W9QYR4_PENBR|nr:hypothetical protein N7452_003061 [Penicillium brevicompactum]
MSLEFLEFLEFLEGFESPPSNSESTDALNNELLVLRDSELGPRLDRAMREGEDIRYLYQAMQDAIWMHRETLVKELLRCKMPISSTYVQTAAEAKAKNILTIFFDNGWDINTPLDELNPPVLAFALEDREMTEWLLDRGADPNMRYELDYTPLPMLFKWLTCRLLIIYLVVVGMLP